MELKITQKNKNPLLERTEVSGTLTFEGATPSNMDLTAAIAKDLGVAANVIVVKNIYTEFSRQHAEFSAVAYKDAAAMDKAERMTKHKRKKMEEAKKAAEEKAKQDAEAKAAEAEKQAEAAKEEVKEETKTEETPAVEEKPAEGEA